MSWNKRRNGDFGNCPHCGRHLMTGCFQDPCEEQQKRGRKRPEPKDAGKYEYMKPVDGVVMPPREKKESA